MSATERSRAFRERNPDYDRKWMAQRRAAANAGVEAKLAVRGLAARAKPVLLLPAPVEDPLMAQLNALKEKLRNGSTESIAMPIDPSSAA